MGMPVSNGVIEIGGLCAVLADDTICRYESISSNGKLNLRQISNSELLNKTPAQTRIVTAAENTTFGTNTAKAAAVAQFNAGLAALVAVGTLTEIQAAYDATAAALIVAGGTPCPE